MSILNLFKGNKKLEKLKAKKAELEREYEEICGSISTLEDEKVRAIQNAAGHSPDSFEYRSSERAYSSANNKQLLYKQQEVKLKELLEEADNQITLIEHAEKQKKLNQIADGVLGSEKDRERAVAEVEVESEKMDDKLGNVRGFADSVYRKAQEDAGAARTNSEFSAAVATAERRNDMTESAGAFAQAVKAAESGMKGDSERQASGTDDKA